jgi:hypothetical protein
VIDKHKKINKNKSKIIKQAKFFICDSGKFQNNLDDQDLMLATVPICHSRCFGIRGGHGKSAFKLVVKLSVELGYVFLSLRL